MAGTNTTDDQIKLFRANTDIWIKMVMAGAVTLGFIGILVKLLFFMDYKNWESTAVLGALEAFFAGTLYKPFSHYFPSKEKK